MYAFKTLTIAAIKMFVRNKQAAFFSLFMPLMIMSVFAFIGFDSVPTTNIGVSVDNPNPPTEQFITQLAAIETFEVTRGTAASERAALEAGDREIVLIIPDNLVPTSDQIATAEPRIMNVLTSVQQPQQVQIGLSAINQMLNKTNLAISQTPELFKLAIEEVSSSNARYIDFLLPGIIAMAIMQMSIFSVSFVFADYKEKGILKRLIATPMRPYQFVAANTITRLLVALAQTAILMAIGVFFIKTQIIGSYPLIFLISALGGVMFLGLGFVISGIAKTVETVPAIANVVAFPMLFLSGVFFPIEAMPDFLRNVVQFLPLTYFASSLREVMGGGATFADISNNLYFMMGWAVVLIGLATFTFKFEEKRV